MQHGLLLLHAVAATSALTVRESGERVVYNALCRRYERAAPIVRRGGLASDEVAIFVSVASLPRYCHVRLDWAASFPSASSCRTSESRPWRQASRSLRAANAMLFAWALLFSRVTASWVTGCS